MLTPLVPNSHTCFPGTLLPIPKLHSGAPVLQKVTFNIPPQAAPDTRCVPALCLTLFSTVIMAFTTPHCYYLISCLNFCLDMQETLHKWQLVFLWHDQDRIFFETIEHSCFCSARAVMADENTHFALPDRELAVNTLLASLNEWMNQWTAFAFSLTSMWSYTSHITSMGFSLFHQWGVGWGWIGRGLDWLPYTVLSSFNIKF